jgi:hypothetical protein
MAILIAGVVLGAVGAHRIAMNLPLSHEQTLAEAKRAVSDRERETESRRSESLQGNVEFQVWQSVLQVTSKVRREKRLEGSIFLLSGVIALIWGVALLYTGRSTDGKRHGANGD